MNYNSNYKRTKIHTAQPSGFIKNDFDQELMLTLAEPNVMNLKCTSKIPEIQLTNSEIKDLRIQEKRNFELENCKLKSFIKDGREKEQQSSEFEKEFMNYSFFEQKTKRIVYLLIY